MGLIFSLTFSLVCGVLGLQFSSCYLELQVWKDASLSKYFVVYNRGAFALLGILVGFVIGAIAYRKITQWTSDLKHIPSQDKIAGLVGFVIGLALTVLAGALLLPIGGKMGPLLVFLAFVLCIYLGGAVAWSMKEELFYFFPALAGKGGLPVEIPSPVNPKLLDTNVIIDGRIADVCRAGFLEGAIYIPGFVLEELHQIADSSDDLKRNRGRRGLDILNEMQSEADIQVRVYDRYDVRLSDSDGVDVKLVKLAKNLDASIITNDFNLNKVAQLYGVAVLNVNELANAVKPVVLPGEEMKVTIVKEGKEINQGVAYLDDGTMVVVENGKRSINQTVPVVVSSVLQTVAGKMIFADLKSGEETKGGTEADRKWRRR